MFVFTLTNLLPFFLQTSPKSAGSLASDMSWFDDVDDFYDADGVEIIDDDDDDDDDDDYEDFGDDLDLIILDSSDEEKEEAEDGEEEGEEGSTGRAANGAVRKTLIFDGQTGLCIGSKPSTSQDKVPPAGKKSSSTASPKSPAKSVRFADEKKKKEEVKAAAAREEADAARLPIQIAAMDDSFDSQLKKLNNLIVATRGAVASVFTASSAELVKYADDNAAVVANAVVAQVEEEDEEEDQEAAAANEQILVELKELQAKMASYEGKIAQLMAKMGDKSGGK